MISAHIIADSINPVGNRLTTFILEYPRFVHSEFMTHRMFSKNAASSRAIPVERMIQQVIDNTATPVWWGKTQSGMQANEELEDSLKQEAKEEWLRARDGAIERVKRLNEIGLHKQIANRILEPWFNIRIICSMTEIQNFFALRAHKDAQPEIRKLAELMLERYNENDPKQLGTGEWHIPFGDNIDLGKLAQTSVETKESSLEELKKKIAIARCARISYLNFEGKDDYTADVKLCDRLFASTPKHLSPTEHVAQALDSEEWSGNFRGWKQYRKFFAEENLTDSRVIKP